MGGDADGRFLDMVTLDTRLSWQGERERAVSGRKGERKGGAAVG